MKLYLLYIWEHIIYCLAEFFCFIFLKLSAKHHELYLKIKELEAKSKEI